VGYEQAIDAQLLPVVRHLEQERPGEAVGVYLFGSAVSSGLRPDSDIDLMMLTIRSMTAVERRALVDLLLRVSGRRGHADTFPDAADRRPIELTSLVSTPSEPWATAPQRDFQYGEWLRKDLIRGDLPAPADDPDVVLLAATALQAHRVLFGPALDTLLAPIPRDVLHDAVIAAVPEVLAGLAGDERNTLLTLARALVTLETGRIVSKDAAVDMIADSLSGRERALLQRARNEYRCAAARGWVSDDGDVIALADQLAHRAKKFSTQRRTPIEPGDPSAR